MSTQTRTEGTEGHAAGISGVPRQLWTPIPGQRQLRLFPEEWFECARCGHDAHIDSTPMPDAMCWECAEQAEVGR